MSNREIGATVLTCLAVAGTLISIYANFLKIKEHYTNQVTTN